MKNKNRKGKGRPSYWQVHKNKQPKSIFYYYTDTPKGWRKKQIWAAITIATREVNKAQRQFVKNLKKAITYTENYALWLKQQ